MNALEIIVTVIIAVLGSSGIWTFATTLYLKKAEKKSLTNKLLLGLGHDRIIYLCEFYIERGWISTEEYENLHDYLYLPYKEMGGNGTAERLVKIVEKLPTIKPTDDTDSKQTKMDI